MRQAQLNKIITVILATERGVRITVVLFFHVCW